MVVSNSLVNFKNSISGIQAKKVLYKLFAQGEKDTLHYAMVFILHEDISIVIHYLKLFSFSLIMLLLSPLLSLRDILSLTTNKSPSTKTDDVISAVMIIPLIMYAVVKFTIIVVYHVLLTVLHPLLIVGCFVV
jgi:fatty acid desaturase